MTTKTVHTPHPMAQSLRTIITEVSDLYLERHAAIEAVIVAILAKQHAFILGPPGTGKSEMAREIISRFIGAEYFEQLLSKTRPDAAVLGPYDLPLLKNTGSFKRKVEGFLPTANFAFIDEVGKMSPTLGHDLLPILNERILHEVNGKRSSHPVPLYSVVTASNELIVEESEDAAALWDRLLVRVVVDYIQETGHFITLMRGPDPCATRTTVNFTDLATVIDTVVPTVVIPDQVLGLVIQLREQLRGTGVEVSDRRWRQCGTLLQASAFLNGRLEVVDDDLHVLRFALWDGPEQIKPVERLTLSLSNPAAEECLRILDDTEQLAAEIRDRKGKSLTEKAAFGAESHGKLKLLSSEASKVREKMVRAKRSTAKADEVLNRIEAVRRTVLVEFLGMDPSMFADPS